MHQKIICPPSDVWLTDDELEQVCRTARTTRDDLIYQLGGYVGFRAFEIPQICPKHVKWSTDGDHYRLRVPHGKDTTAESIAPDAPLVDLTERGVRAVVKRTADYAAAATGDDDFRYVSSHDFRRRFAQRLLVDRQMNPRVMMQVGGWDSFQAIEPYLNAPTPEVVNAAFADAGLA
jgi:integrase